MKSSKRTTVCFESSVHRALRLKAAASDRSISKIVNEAVGRALAKDEIDLAAAKERATEPGLDFAVVAQALKRRGRI